MYQKTKVLNQIMCLFAEFIPTFVILINLIQICFNAYLVT